MRIRARAAPLFGNQHAAAAEFAQSPQFVGGKFLFAIALADVRAHFGFHELAHGVSDQALIIGERKVHAGDECEHRWSPRIQVAGSACERRADHGCGL